ncbi:hypothetical protein D3C83_59850 [compost metagenome]
MGTRPVSGGSGSMIGSMATAPLSANAPVLTWISSRGRITIVLCAKSTPSLIVRPSGNGTGSRSSISGRSTMNS